MQTNFKITNLHCDACIKISRLALEKLAGVESIDIDKEGNVKIESAKTLYQNDIKLALDKVDKTVSF